MKKKFDTGLRFQKDTLVELNIQQLKATDSGLFITTIFIIKGFMNSVIIETGTPTIFQD